jgi:hypothetical protein
MLPVGQTRFAVLHQWYPEEIRHSRDWVHRACLTALGLNPLPDDDLPLADVVGATVTARIVEVADQHREVRGLCALIQVVCRQLEREYSIPTQNGREQLRWMVSRWVTINLGRDRGGVPATQDWAPVVDHNADVADLALTKAMFAGMVTLEQTRGLQPGAPPANARGLIEVIQMPEDTVSRITTMMITTWSQEQAAHQAAQERTRLDIVRIEREEHASTVRSRGEVEAANARRAERETEVRARELEVRAKELDLKMLEMKQASAPSDEPPPCKKARTTAPGPAADMPRWRGKRFSISHIVWAEVGAPDVETVFQTVHRWFRNREDAPYRCPLDVAVLRADHDVPVVYVLPAECRRGLAERHRDALLQHVRHALMPEEVDDPAENCADPGGVTTNPVPPAPCFVMARAVVGPPPPELQPPSLAQQAQDLADLARMIRLRCRHPNRLPTGVAEADWPARPSEAHAARQPTATAVRAYGALPGNRPLRVHGPGRPPCRAACGQFLRVLAWAEPVPLHNYYLRVVASKLRGWAPGPQKGYLPAMAGVFHRALVATRGLTNDHPVVTQLVDRWHLPRFP